MIATKIKNRNEKNMNNEKRKRMIFNDRLCFTYFHFINFGIPINVIKAKRKSPTYANTTVKTADKPVAFSKTRSLNGSATSIQYIKVPVNRKLRYPKSNFVLFISSGTCVLSRNSMIKITITASKNEDR
jgi:hypothetical protein